MRATAIASSPSARARRVAHARSSRRRSRRGSTPSSGSTCAHRSRRSRPFGTIRPIFHHSMARPSPQRRGRARDRNDHINARQNGMSNRANVTRSTARPVSKDRANHDLVVQSDQRATKCTTRYAMERGRSVWRVGVPNIRRNQRKRLFAELIDMVCCFTVMDELLSGRDSPPKHIGKQRICKHIHANFCARSGARKRARQFAAPSS